MGGVVHQILGLAVEVDLGIAPLARLLRIHVGESALEGHHGRPVIPRTLKSEPCEHVAPPTRLDAARSGQLRSLGPSARLGHVEDPLPEYPRVTRNLRGEL